jgi:hypothetical protein
MSEVKAAQEADNKCNGKPSFKNGKKQCIKPQQTQLLNSDSEVPMLCFGAGNNFDLFKRKISTACMEKYKNLGQLIMDEQYYAPDAVDTSLYDLTNDHYDVDKERLREAHKHRDKEINDMQVDHTSMYAYLISKLSKESQDDIQGHTEWLDIEKTRDPLKLGKVIKSCHQILTTSKVAAVIKKTACEEYAACKQGPFEHIMDYKRRFDVKLDALVAIGNAAASDADVAMDFMYGLVNGRYAEFKTEVVNDMKKGSIVSLDNLNKMHVVASRRVVVKVGKDSGSATLPLLIRRPRRVVTQKVGKQVKSRLKEVRCKERQKKRRKKKQPRS